AIRERRVVCFEYPGSRELTERSVEPWALSVQGRALYLWGWDLDRGGERTFRVSRIRSQISFIGEPGDASLAPEGATFPRVSSFVSPVVHVRVDSTARTLLHGYEAGASSEEYGSPQHGLERVALEGAEMGTWIGRLLPLASDVVVVAPQPLRDAMLTRLRAAATWGEIDA
ncbi:MAG: WYL domain-containing protein, partial [Actinomyces sp.]|nr:WYL domain-containing protein [Actinomyces sp.]